VGETQSKVNNRPDPPPESYYMGHHPHMILMFISLAIPKQALIISALKITLKNWSRYGMMCINPAMVIGGHMS